MDWPRIPWPKSKAFLVSSAALGHAVAALLDVEQEVLAEPLQGLSMTSLRQAFRGSR